MPNYENSMIYKIVNDEMPNMVYYGSTCNTLRQRFVQHKSKNDCSSKKLFEFGKAQIILVEKFPCNDKMELTQRERFYIENNECVNKQIPNRTYKEYYQDNKEKIAEQQKEWYELNKEKCKEQQNQYNQVNKEKRNQKHDCECGGKFTYANKSNHDKTKKHINYFKNI